MRKKRKGSETDGSEKLSLSRSSNFRSHFSLEGYARLKKRCKESDTVEEDSVGSFKRRLAGVATAPPCGASSLVSSGRGLKRKIGCIDVSTQTGRKNKIEDDYVFGPSIGKGKFGSVRICRSRSNGMDFACKTLKKGEETVHREIEIMQHLSGHPRVVTLHAVYEESDCFHLVMELCSGGRLVDQMVKEGKYSEQRAANVFKDLMLVISYCHEMGVVHRDVKPENILLTAAGKIQLADFGLAMRIALSLTMAANFKRVSFLLALLMTVATVLTPSLVSGENGFSDLQIRKHLKRLNKRPLKSIKSPDGDLIDCVPITDQPALAHPLLINHAVQMRPSFNPESVFSESKVSSKNHQSSAITQLWHVNGKCPENTIPIRRTRKQDLYRASSVEKFGMKNLKSIPKPTSYEPASVLTQNGHQHAIMYVEDGVFYGAKAKINVWNPDVEMPNEFSLAQIWVLGGNFNSDLNSIEAGWQVSPQLYGDNRTRLFTYWTSDAYQGTGCYNLLCSGFVQINREIAMGGSISPLSNYGNSQYDITILIWKDPKEGHWWLQFGEKYIIGYWPASLFSYLSESASMIEWGGEVVNSQSEEGQHTTTQMGSGRFAEEGWGKASYFKNVQVVDGSNELRNPENLQVFTDQENCYNVKSGDGGSWGSHFYYGGPGRNPNCP